MSISKKAIWINYKLHCWKADKIYNRALKTYMIWTAAALFSLVAIIISLVIIHTPQ